MTEVKINYQKRLEEELSGIDKAKTRPKLLLHSCCGPCSSYVLEYLCAYFEVTLLYYNPNIYPESEYILRRDDQIRLLQEMESENEVGYIEGEYEPEAYYSAVKGYEDEPEGGARCVKCFELRLSYTARRAADMGFDYFTTTLSVSPHKNAQLLNAIGKSLADQYKVKYLYSDFKKKNGYKRSVELAKTYGLYRQDYCGCEFSMRGRLL